MSLFNKKEPTMSRDNNMPRPQLPRIVPNGPPGAQAYAPRDERESSEFARGHEKYMAMVQEVDLMRNRVMDAENRADLLEKANEIIKEERDAIKAERDELKQLVLEARTATGIAGKIVLDMLRALKKASPKYIDTEQSTSVVTGEPDMEALERSLGIAPDLPRNEGIEGEPPAMEKPEEPHPSEFAPKRNHKNRNID